MSNSPIEGFLKSRIHVGTQKPTVDEIKEFCDRQISHCMQFHYEVWGIECDFYTYTRWTMAQFGKSNPQYLLTHRGHLVHIVQKPACYVAVHYFISNL